MATNKLNSFSDTQAKTILSHYGINFQCINSMLKQLKHNYTGNSSTNDSKHFNGNE